MDRAEELFARLRAGGNAAIEELLAAGEAEALFLDFKGDRGTDPAHTKLHADAFRGLSRGVSGFGNTAGGVLLWGIDCRKNGQGVEEAQRAPLKDAAGFRTKVEGALSRATYPPHPRVETHVILESDGSSEGYVAVLVPRAENGPLRSLETHTYLLRIGSNFDPAPHEVLAGMFGRGPRPEVNFNLIPHPVRIEKDRGLVLAFSLAAVNLGSVLADRPFLSLWFNDLPQECIAVRCRTPADYSQRQAVLPGIAIVANPGISIPPGAPEQICDVTLILPAGLGKEVALDCVIGAEGALPCRFRLHGDAAAINKAFEDATLGRQRMVTDYIKQIGMPAQS